jgi:fructan beta-fructosidase
VKAQQMSCLGNQAALAAEGGTISLNIFVDRASVDIYGGGGTLYMPMASALSPKNRGVKLSCQGGDARILSLKVHELNSAW